MISKTKNTASIRQPNTGRILGTAALALAAVLVSGAGVKASTVIVTPSNFASSGWSVQDVRSGGTSSFSSAQPRDGNGSYELSLAVSLTDNSKATLFHPGGDGLALSDFIAGSNNLGFEYYRDGTSTANTIDAPAFRLYFGTGKPQLVWEASYNGITSSTPVPPNSWQTNNIKDGKFWKYDSTGNHSDAIDAHDLNYWSSDTSTTGAILGYSLGVGSGWGGSYKGYVDNVTFGTTTTNFENAAAAPEPSQWAGLGFTAFGALGLILKARKKKSAVSAS